MSFEQGDLKREIEEMIKEGGEMYRGLDANDDGTVSTAEVKKAVNGKKEGASEARSFLYDQLLSCLDEVDKNNDGKVSIVEFMKFYDNLKQKHDL